MRVVRSFTANDRNIDLSVERKFGQLGFALGREVNLDPGKGVVYFTYWFAQQVQVKRIAYTQPHRHTSALADVIGQHGRGIAAVKYGLQIGQYGLAKVRQVGAVSLPKQQCSTKLLLKLLYRLRQGGLGDIALFGSPREIQRAG